MRDLSERVLGLAKGRVGGQGTARVEFGVVQSAVGVSKLKFAGTEVKMDRRSEVEGLGVLVVEGDCAAAVVEG
jgi:hypothetical protein